MQVDSVDLVEQSSQAREMATTISDTTPIDLSLVQLCRFAEVNPGTMHRISSSPALADVTQLGEFLVDKEVAAQVADDGEKEKLFLKTASAVYPPCVVHFVVSVESFCLRPIPRAGGSRLSETGVQPMISSLMTSSASQWRIKSERSSRKPVRTVHTILCILLSKGPQPMPWPAILTGCGWIKS